MFVSILTDPAIGAFGGGGSLARYAHGPSLVIAADEICEHPYAEMDSTVSCVMCIIYTVS